MPEISLDGARVLAARSQLIALAVPQHMRMHGEFYACQLAAREAQLNDVSRGSILAIFTELFVGDNFLVAGQLRY